MTWPPRPAVLAALIAIVGVAVFTPSLFGGWIYDDHLLLAQNPYIHSFEHWPRWYMTGFWDIGEEFVRLGARIAYWRPFVTTTYGLDWQLGGGTPFVFHVTNLLWQAAVGALTFLVVRRWLDALWPAVVAAVLFLVHPTKAESVAWISGRTDVICMAGILFATQGIARRLAGKPGGLLMEVGGTLVAYMSKEQSIVLPAFAAIEGWVAAGRPAIERASIVRMLKAALPQIVVAVVYLGLRKLLLPLAVEGARANKYGLGDHLQVVLDTMGRFIELTFVPHEFSMQHGLVRIADGSPVHSVPHMIVGAVALAGFVAAAILLRRRMPIVTLGIGFYLFTLAPTLNIINTQMETLVAERFLYLPFLGIAVIIGGLVAVRPARWAYALIGVAIAITATLAIVRSSHFADEDHFWARELELHPDSSAARMAAARVAIRERRYHAALFQTLELSRHASQNQDVAAAMDIAQLLADLTPDHDRKSLETIDTFVADMLARKAPVAVLELRGLKFVIPTTTAVYELGMRSYELRLFGLRSNIRSRLGDDAAAVLLANEALTRCPRCLSSVIAATLALARAGDYEQAAAVLQQGEQHIARSNLEAVRKLLERSRAEHARAQTTSGPAQLQARSAALAALELWGRAYDVVAPYKDQIKQAPKAAIGFAELAFRAGETEVAREVLAAIGTPDIDAQLHRWATAMGWAE